MCVFVCVCVCACVRMCACLRACVRACVRVRVRVTGCQKGGGGGWRREGPKPTVVKTVMTK